MTLRQGASSYWVLDRNGGTKILVTPENRQLYSNSIRYIKLDAEPVPNDTQEILGILDKQYEEGIKREDFTQEDIDIAAEGMKSRRFYRESRKASQQAELPEDLVPPTTATAAPAAQAQPETVELAEGEPTVPKKSTAKKSTKKKAAK